ncbi:MAG: transposase [Oscillospiraceae bacterium]|nr:transposase [Oscillospiraceae bacterium]
MKRYGKIIDKYINNINSKYPHITVDKYVIMPNHIHLMIRIDGMMWASSPTTISDIVRSIKILTTKEIGKSIFQRSFHDHIIRDDADYLKIWNYIETNPDRWREDCFYVE